jgi:hypothetical protein
VLISRESGLGRLLSDVVSDGERATPREVLTTAGDDAEVAQAWGTAITDRFLNPNEAFARAAAVRRQLLAATSWDAALAEILAELGLT